MGQRALPDAPVIRPSDLVRLRRDAATSATRRARACLHPDEQAPVQDMVIALCNDGYVRPHRHAGKSETFHVIEGAATIVLFDNAGVPQHRVQLGFGDDDRALLFRIPQGTWHTVVVESPSAILHETTSGPFVRDQTEWASWAPPSEDLAAAREFVSALLR